MKDSITIRYRVTYGPLQEEYRNKRDFDDEDMADSFFKKKEAGGLHVNVYRIEVKTTIEKIV